MFIMQLQQQIVYLQAFEDKTGRTKFYHEQFSVAALLKIIKDNSHVTESLTAALSNQGIY